MPMFSRARGLLRRENTFVFVDTAADAVRYHGQREQTGGFCRLSGVLQHNRIMIPADDSTVAAWYGPGGKEAPYNFSTSVESP